MDLNMDSTEEAKKGFLCFGVWLFSLNKMISSSIYFPENAMIPFLFIAEIKADLDWSIYDSVMVLTTDFQMVHI